MTLYDTLGEDSTSFIINQCEIKTIFCTSDKIQILADLKQKEEIPTLENVVLLDAGKYEQTKAGEDAGLHIF